MASEIRVNQIQNRSGLSTVTFSDTGVVLSGITTITDLRTTGGALIVGTGASVYSPATNVLSLGTNNTEKVRIDSSGNFNLVNTAGIMTAFKYETPALINNHFKSQSTTAGAYVRMYASASSGQWDIYGNGANLRFSDNASSGNIQMDRPLSMNSQNIIMSSGYGIDFSATANSSGTMTSELLADYEEGTWSPRITGDGGASGQSYNIQSGWYRRIGTTVFLTYDVQLTTLGTLSGSYVVLGNLPFTNGLGSNSAGTVTIGYYSGWSNIPTGSHITAYSSTSNVYLMTPYGNTGNDYILISDGSATNSSRLIGTLMYFCDA